MPRYFGAFHPTLGARGARQPAVRSIGSRVLHRCDNADTRGVSRWTFKTFTVGTLLAIGVFCTVGSFWAQHRGDAGADFSGDLHSELTEERRTT